MLWQLFDLLGGWKTIRSRSGYLYQVSRGGKRRIVPMEGWAKPAMRDDGWLENGRFADDLIVNKYGNFHVSTHYLDERKAHRRAMAAA
jgi:hypothetical protein